MRSAPRSYKYVDVVPTHVHPNFDKLHWADIGDNYVPYNKPGSIKHWCATCHAAADRPPQRGSEAATRRPVPRSAADALVAAGASDGALLSTSTSDMLRCAGWRTRT